MRGALVVLLLLAAACRSATAAPSVPTQVTPVSHTPVPREVAERYATDLAKAAWMALHRLPKEQAILNIHAHLQAFSDMTGCSIAASRPKQFAPAEHRGFVQAVYRNVIVAVKCP
jgi:hypothetical protein